MALGATVYALDIDLADADRAVYTTLALRAARHPSETSEFFLTRVLAYCLEYTEGIGFSNGLFAPDEPAIAVRDLTGALRVWIDVGTPEASRLHRASKAAPRVAVYTHKDGAQLAQRLCTERIHRLEALELYALDRQWLAALAGRIARRMKFTLTVAGQHTYLTLGQETLAGQIERIALAQAPAAG